MGVGSRGNRKKVTEMGKVMTIDEYRKDGAGAHFADGILKVVLPSWENFRDVVNKFAPYKNDYLWRGQPDDKCLQSSFDRVWKGDARSRKESLSRHLKNFREKMRESHPQVDLPADDDSLWALGRHYGLMAPILDWTQSPYIAAYFAFEQAGVGSDDRYRYVYALSLTVRRLLIEWKKGGIVLSKERAIQFQPMNELLSPLSPRFLAQKSTFTRVQPGKSIEKRAEQWSQKRPQEVVLLKVEIPNRDREKCLAELGWMGINYASLMLELRDVVEKCNKELRDCAALRASQ
jgi:hypothetical protein